MTRTPTLCLTFDNLGQARNVFSGKAALPDPSAPGITIGYPNIVRLLAALGLRATFFVEGWSALHYKDVIDTLSQAGHEIGLHGWIHEDFAALPELTARQFINDGLASLEQRGVRPIGFRAPGGTIGPYAAGILPSMGFAYDSSVETSMSLEIPSGIDDYRGDGLKRMSNGLIGIPWQWFMIDAIHYVFSPSGLRDPAELAAYWSRILRNVARHGGFVTLICHAHVSGVEPDRLAALETVLRLAQELGFAILPGERAMHATEHLA